MVVMPISELQAGGIKRLSIYTRFVRKSVIPVSDAGGIAIIP